MARMTAEQIYRGMLRGPLYTKAGSASNQWSGRTSVASGVSTVTVSTTTITSDALVLAGWQSDVASNVAQVIKVHSLAEGSYFGMTVTPAPVGTDFTIGWTIIRTN